FDCYGLPVLKPKNLRLVGIASQRGLPPLPQRRYSCRMWMRPTAGWPLLLLVVWGCTGAGDDVTRGSDDSVAAGEPTNEASMPSSAEGTPSAGGDPGAGGVSADASSDPSASPPGEVPVGSEPG